LADTVRRTIADVDPELPVLFVRTHEDLIKESSETMVMIARTAVGAVLGVPLLIALHANFPFTERVDPAVILPAALALALTALVAGWVPARRASSIAASDAFRAD
jgi:hypothetical protein